ncbi:MAG: hypothetical protein DBX59_08345 [Bacillota bacterium]|nr:MAG: hypothetical protein DBX59_08345 [Bacillota bacterium]
MQEEKKNIKKCVYCEYYEGYYTKGLYRFDRVKQGKCSRLDKIVNNKDVCECWRKRSRIFYLRRRSASRALYEIMMDISAIRQIFQEDQEERDKL